MSEERTWRRGHRRRLLVAYRPAVVSVGGGGKVTTAASIRPADPFATGETMEGVALVGVGWRGTSSIIMAEARQTAGGGYMDMDPLKPQKRRQRLKN